LGHNSERSISGGNFDTGHFLFKSTIQINQTWELKICLVVFRPTPLKNHGVKVSWDDDIPNMMGKINQIFQTTNQKYPVELDDIYI